MMQAQLNNSIAEELNKWQPIFEYGRMTLDDDKDLRDKYKWLIYLKKGLPCGIILTVVEGLFSFFTSETLLYGVAAILLLLVIIAVAVYYNHRHEISKLISKEKRTKLDFLLTDTNKYLSNLEIWLVQLDMREETSKEAISYIEMEFVGAKATQLPNDNKFSMLYGKIDKEREMQAKELANKRLQHLKMYI